MYKCEVDPEDKGETRDYAIYYCTWLKVWAVAHVDTARTVVFRLHEE